MLCRPCALSRITDPRWHSISSYRVQYMGPANKTECGFDSGNGWVACPNWQETNLTEFPPWSYGINNWTHAGFLELAAGFIPWYKGPADAPFPPVTPDKEGAFFFYNLQAINTTCPNE